MENEIGEMLDGDVDIESDHLNEIMELFKKPEPQRQITLTSQLPYSKVKAVLESNKKLFDNNYGAIYKFRSEHPFILKGMIIPSFIIPENDIFEYCSNQTEITYIINHYVPIQNESSYTLNFSSPVNVPKIILFLIEWVHPAQTAPKTNDINRFDIELETLENFFDIEKSQVYLYADGSYRCSLDTNNLVGIRIPDKFVDGTAWIIETDKNINFLNILKKPLRRYFGIANYSGQFEQLYLIFTKDTEPMIGVKRLYETNLSVTGLYSDTPIVFKDVKVLPDKVSQTLDLFSEDMKSIKSPLSTTSTDQVPKNIKIPSAILPVKQHREEDHVIKNNEKSEQVITQFSFSKYIPKTQPVNRPSNQTTKEHLSMALSNPSFLTKNFDSRQNFWN